MATTMNVSLPESLKDFVDERVDADGYSSSSEYVRALIRRERDRTRLRDLLLEGAASPLTGPVTSEHFEELRERVRTASATKT
ncbi:MAG: type II toxin-antitoxin system ParD family antitoxin [Micrococcales bacterium]|nr:type II toxin-antitoxin system ParD family antitoxin [Micrococcales bacterium]